MPTATSCKVVLLVGLPASGKSTWARDHGIPALGSDNIRLLLTDDETDQSANKQVFATLRRLLRVRLDLARPVTAIDATNLTPKERRQWLKIAQSRGATVEAVYFATPFETCLARNRRRRRLVPEQVIHWMRERLVVPTLAEGFARVRTVRPPKRQR